MNKTININLAGLFFHIDEDAYLRLQRYLAAVRKSFAGSTGSDEIMSDIESRIAELFLERRANDQQVISASHVEEVITIMGQPEDYEVDEEIFDEPKNRSRKSYSGANKQLFRDTQNGYIGGVSAGLSYYLGIEMIWVRVLMVLLAFLTAGYSILGYIVLWIFVPDAVTTNQRLTMMGKEVNISNIEENFKAGFEPVADGQTDASHSNVVGQRGKRGTVKFFSFLGRLIKGIAIAFVKILGLILFLAGSIALVALVVSTITASAVNVDGNSLLRFFNVVIPAEQASWWFVLAIILAAGIPLFLLAILGLKMLVSRLKSIGGKTYLSLTGVWIIAVIVLSVMVGQLAASTATSATVQRVDTANIDDNIVFEMALETSNDRTMNLNNNEIGFEVSEQDGINYLKVYDVRVAVGTTTDSLASVEMIYEAYGSSFDEARNKADLIKYNYELTDSTFTGADYVLVQEGSGIPKHNLQMTIYLPEGTKARFNRRFGQRYRSNMNRDAITLGNNIDYTYQIKNGKAVCVDCPVEETQAKETTDEPTTENANWKYDGNDGVEKNNQP
ncbi:PspC domain-containing protein [Nonlabens ponticola]|uniref:PspC domain-containing protein n=1 Tax=Nonlabens ponticola TaxID=2496866 RepID=A0A3S9MXX8_9FLAO|nr:PspC domain-containing protein [Nonlabens ponticola]AZQ43997.1 PspC domain-containing protein [Nonlabens ponticola]